jgi:ribonuclease HI
LKESLAIWFDSPKKDEKSINIWIDGLCEPINPGGTACIGFVIKKNGETIAKGCEVIGKGEGMTNNVAEYTALIYSLKEIKRLKLENEFLKIRSDSQLLVNQINRVWSVKAPLIIPLYKITKELANDLHYRIEWVPREENEEADKLTRLAYKRSLK